MSYLPKLTKRGMPSKSHVFIYTFALEKWNVPYKTKVKRMFEVKKANL